jgi:protein SCO1/2
MNHAHFIVAITACVIAAGAPGAARGHGEVHKHDAAAAAAPSAAKVVLRGDPLLDQTGKRVRLADDVIGGRIAVVNFIYTTCTTVCPVASATFQQLQGRVGAALGKDVVLVSISVDPLRDTPERLREYAGRYQAREGWTWLTGSKPNVDAVLKGFGAYAPNFEDHPSMVLVGDAGGWTRFLGFPAVDQLLARVEDLRAARAQVGRTAQHAGH